MTGLGAILAFRGAARRGIVGWFAAVWIASSAGAGPWPEGSSLPLLPLENVSLQTRVTALGPRLQNGFQFVAFGDQRALADGEWQAMMRHIAAWDQDDSRPEPLLFALDTGDIVQDGRHSDQFTMLREILAPIRHIPYFVAPGNHELNNERDPRARANLTGFLGLPQVDGQEAPLHQEIRFKSLRILIVDSNLLTYKRPDESDESWSLRGDAELRWLASRLEEDDPAVTTVLALHHPLLQTSKKHRDKARKMWSRRFEGKQLAELLLDGGVDVVLCGHTHTYELFRISREDGRSFWHVNVSGRPRNSFLWFGSGARSARDIGGEELEWLEDEDFEDLDGWKIEQLDVMDDYELNQFAAFTVGADGSLHMQIVYVGREDSDPIAPQPRRTLVTR